MLVVRTDEQKAAMVESLRKQRKKAPEFTFFGDNNHEGIDAQIKVIEQEMNEDGVYDDFQDEDHVRDMALDAVYWLQGTNEDEVLSSQFL